MNREDKEVTIRLPEKLMKELGVFSLLENKDINQFIKEAVQHIICERNKCQLHETMKVGYEEMGAINLALAELGVCVEKSLLEDYESCCREWKDQA